MDNKILFRALKDGVGPSRGKSRPFFSTNSFTPNILLWSEDVSKKLGASWCGHQLGLRFLEFDLSTSGTVFQVKHAPPPIHVCDRWNWWESPQVNLAWCQLAHAWATCLYHLPQVVVFGGTVEAPLEGGPWLATWRTTFPGATLQVRSVRAAFCPGSGLGDANGGWDGGRGGSGDSPWVEN